MTAPLLIISFPEYPGKKFEVHKDCNNSCGNDKCAFFNTFNTGCDQIPATWGCVDDQVYFKEVA